MMFDLVKEFFFGITQVVGLHSAMSHGYYFWHIFLERREPCIYLVKEIDDALMCVNDKPFYFRLPSSKWFGTYFRRPPVIIA